MAFNGRDDRESLHIQHKAEKWKQIYDIQEGKKGYEIQSYKMLINTIYWQLSENYKHFIQNGFGCDTLL